MTSSISSKTQPQTRGGQFVSRLAAELPVKHPRIARRTAQLLRGMAALIASEGSAVSTAHAKQAMWRSPLLGELRRIELKQGSVEYYERGSGPTVVLLHGWLANANLWRNVVDVLQTSFRCVTVDLPLGSHRVPMPTNTDLSPDGIAELIASLLEHLGAVDVTVVGNDSGGAYAQIATARHTNRVGRLVLSSSETPSDHWPPAQFDYLCRIARSPEAMSELADGLKTTYFRKMGYGPDFGIAKRLPPADVVATYALPIAVSQRIRIDTAAVINSVSTAALHSASRQLASSTELPVLLAWSSEDPVFPVAHAQKFAQELPNAQIVIFDDAYSFTPEDQPEAVARAIREFVLGRADA